MSKEFKRQRQVEFAETDMAGIMHFSNFFRYMETTEHAFYRSLGIPIHPQKPQNTVGWPRVHAECDYKQPLYFEDLVEIRLVVSEIKKKAVRYEFKFFRLDKEKKQEVAEGKFIVVYVELDEKQHHFSPQPIPPEIKEKLQDFCSQI